MEFFPQISGIFPKNFRSKNFEKNCRDLSLSYYCFANTLMQTFYRRLTRTHLPIWVLRLEVPEPPIMSVFLSIRLLKIQFGPTYSAHLRSRTQNVGPNSGLVSFFCFIAGFYQVNSDQKPPDNIHRRFLEEQLPRIFFFFFFLISYFFFLFSFFFFLILDYFFLFYLFYFFFFLSFFLFFFFTFSLRFSSAHKEMKSLCQL